MDTQILGAREFYFFLFQAACFLLLLLIVFTSVLFFIEAASPKLGSYLLEKFRKLF